MRDVTSKCMVPVLLSTTVAMTAVFALRPSDTESKPYNVLFLSIDDWGQDLNVELGAYARSPLRTPNLDALAAESVSFPNAYCPFPLCGPSRIATMLGIRPLTTGFLSNENLMESATWDGHPTLEEQFQRGGFHVGGAGKIYHNGGHSPDSWHEYYRDHDDPTVPRPGNPAPEMGHRPIYWGVFENGVHRELGRKREAKHVDAGLDMMSRFPEPWFIAVGFPLPHRPFTYPEAWGHLYQESEVAPLPPQELTGEWKTLVHPRTWDSKSFLASADHPRGTESRHHLRRSAQVAYWRCVSYVDHEIGRLLNGMKAQGFADRTVVVLVSDHGWSMGHHDRYGKGALWEWESRALVMVREPGMSSAGQTSWRPVEHIDLYPTLMELCGQPAPPRLEGDSLVPLLRDPTAAANPAFCVIRKRGPDAIEGRMVRTDRYKLTYWHTDAHQLYDLENDPGEYRNLFGRPSHDEVVMEHFRHLQDEGLLEGESFSFEFGAGVAGSLGIPTLSSSDPVPGERLLVSIGNAVGRPTVAKMTIIVAPTFRLTSPDDDDLVFEPYEMSVELPVGGRTVKLPLPDDPALEGAVMFLEVSQTDPGAVSGTSRSRGLCMYLGRSSGRATTSPDVVLARD